MTIANKDYILEDIRHRLSDKHIKENFAEFYDFLLKKYPKIPKISQRLYCYYYHLEDAPKCPICGRPRKYNGIVHGYATFCSNECRKSKEGKIIIQEKTKQTNLEHYGVEWNIASKESRRKQIQTCLEKYGVKYSFQSDNNKKKSKQTKLERYGDENYNNTSKSKQTKLERYGDESYNNMSKNKQTKLEHYGDENYNNTSKSKQTCLERYGTDNYFGSDEFKKDITKYNNEHYNGKYFTQTKEFKDKSQATCIEHYGVEHYSKTQECKNRIYNTKKKNHTFNTSNIEQQFKKWLDDNKIEYKYQYKSEEYPFVCDFYFPLKDLYLEIQGSWVHGGHPFDPSNKEDIKTLNKWKEKNTKFYDNAINIWTIRDVRKREVGKNLNWKEVFTNDINELKDIIYDWI